MLVPKSCLTAGLGKDGGFSKKAPDICCLVYALGAGTRFAETSSGQPATKRGNVSWVRIELALLLFYCLGLRASQYFRHQCSTGSSFRCRSEGG